MDGCLFLTTKMVMYGCFDICGTTFTSRIRLTRREFSLQVDGDGLFMAFFRHFCAVCHRNSYAHRSRLIMGVMSMWIRGPASHGRPERKGDARLRADWRRQEQR